jgi:hypothetical protein
LSGNLGELIPKLPIILFLTLTQTVVLYLRWQLPL